MKNLRLLFLSVWLVMASPSVRADIVLPNVRAVDACFRLTNVSQYPNYVFVLYSQNRFEDYCRVLQPNDCLGLGKQSYSVIYAIPRSRFKPDSIKIGASDADRQRLRQYFSNKSNAVGSRAITCSRYIPQQDAAIAVEDRLRIQSLSADTLVIVYDNVQYTYPGGRTSKRVYTNQEERPSSSYLSPGINTPIWLATGGIALIGLLIVIRNRKR